MCHGPGVQVVPLLPSAGPVPPPIIVVTPLLSASSTCCGARKWTWVSTAPAVATRCSPEITSVPGPITRSGSTPSWVRGLPALPIPTMRPARTPRSPLTTPSTPSSTTTLVITRSSAPDAAVAVGSWAIPSRIALPPPYTASSPKAPTLQSRSTSTTRLVSASVKRSPTDGPNRSTYVRRGSTAGSGHGRSSAPTRSDSSGAERNPRSTARSNARSRTPASSRATTSSPPPWTSPAKPAISRLPPTSHSVTVRVSPGSKRTAVPDAMSRCIPYAAARSKRSTRFTSKKW